MEINISWCHLVSHNGVEALARGCNKITRFSSKGCKQVNDDAVKCLSTYCKDIEVLNLHSCDVCSFLFFLSQENVLIFNFIVDN